MTSIRRRTLELGCVALLAFALTELVLFAAERASPRVGTVLRDTPRAVPDARLGRRPNRALAEHDARGWRNPRRPERTFAAAIGDSQTYGVGVAPGEAWPQRLSVLSGRSVYGLALGAYGPVEYERLLDEAFELSPRVVLVGFYAGNDLADAYLSAYRRGLAPELRSADPELRARCAALDARGELTDTWRETFIAREGHGVVMRGLRRVGQSSRTVLLGLAAWRAVATKLGPTRDDGGAGLTPFEKGRAQAASAGRDLLLPFEDSALSTVFLPAARLAALDTGDPRIEEGLRITLSLFRRMADRCAGRCAFAVVGIPTKELIFAERVGASGTGQTATYLEVTRRETLLWERVGRSLAAAGIPLVDTLPGLRALLAEGRNPYRGDSDGHPIAVGTEAIARAVLASGVLDLPPRAAPPGFPVDAAPR